MHPIEDTDLARCGQQMNHRSMVVAGQFGAQTCPDVKVAEQFGAQIDTRCKQRNMRFTPKRTNSENWPALRGGGSTKAKQRNGDAGAAIPRPPMLDTGGNGNANWHSIVIYERDKTSLRAIQ